MPRHRRGAPVLRPLLLLFALLAYASGARAHFDDVWLVAIGNDAGDPTETTLLYAQRDAREVAEAFRSYGGVQGNRITMLLGNDADTVRRALIDINATIRARAGQDQQTLLIVFYSGHADATALHLDGTHLDFAELRKVVEGSSATMRLLIVDSCRSGAVTRVKGVKPAPSFAIALEEPASAEGMAIISSSAAGESSQESDALQSSFFSHHFVNALRGAADRDGDGAVTLSEAYAYAYTQTLRSTGKTLALQHPTYSYDVRGRAPVVLARPRDASAQAGFLRLSRKATYLIAGEDGTNNLVAEISTETEGVLVALARGSYVIQERLPTEYREYRVSLARGAEIDLAKQAYESATYDRLVRSRGGSTDLAHGALALGGARGELLAGEGITPQLLLGYVLDLPWSSFGVRLRGARASSSSTDGQSTGHHEELALGLSLSRMFDLRWFSAGLGVLFEGSYHHQVRHSAAGSTTRNLPGGGLGALFSLERHLVAGSALRLEGGPLTEVYRQAKIEQGAQVGTSLATLLTWWAGGGLVWRR